MYRRTKIICTIGPASEDIAVLRELLKAGMNVARLNFSHGTHEEHKKRIASIRQASHETGIPVAIMLDTKGPEIRIGLLEKGKVEILEGEKIILTTQEVLGTNQRIMVNYADLPLDLEVGTSILLDDGLLELSVIKVEDTEIHCKVVNGGVLTDRKKVNVPGVNIKLPGLTSKDIADITLGAKEGVDYIAASFIRSAADVLAIRKVIEEQKTDIAIISKIENRQGVLNLEEIIKVSDGIMVARGDLGVEIPAEEVPIVQKKLIDKCNLAGKPVITATQMLDSMIRNPRPTRAEASDIANAIYDGTDAIMLSGETATGKYPLQAVLTMARIAKRIEESLNWAEMSQKRASIVGVTITEAISNATCDTAHSLGADAIITATKTGSTARMVSKYRPLTPIIAVTPSPQVLRQLLLVWGVYPLLSPETDSTDLMIDTAVKTTLEAEYITQGDLVVITAGVPVGIPGSTNLIKVHTIGEILARGTGIGKHPVIGRAVIARCAKEAEAQLKKGDILITVATDRDFIPVLEQAGALVTEEGGLTSHGAIVGLNLGIPVIVGVENASKILSQETIITVDPERGLIYRGSTRVL
ncbi:MAG: pyruvate kinase [Firmicutes bacterium HGW-Firmicutes-12]|nr:MAG: pyruvate kinase [Firmicutes bacterium HGW-Firmicutes-12]